MSLEIIYDEPENTNVTFGDLLHGDLFRLVGDVVGSVWMKTYGDDEISAVDLADGVLLIVEGEQEVERLNGKLYVSALIDSDE